MKRIRCFFFFFIIANSAMATLLSQENSVGAIVLTGHRGAVTALAFSPDGRYLASGGSDGIIKIWDMATGRELRSMKSGGVSSLAFSPDGKFIAAGSWDTGAETVMLFNTESGEKTGKFSTGWSSTRSVDISSDKKFLAALVSDNIRIYEIPSGVELRTLKYKKKDSESVRSMRILEDNQQIALATSKRIMFLDAETGKIRHTINDATVTMDISGNGKFLAAGNTEKETVVYDVTKRKKINEFKGYNRSINTVGLSHDGAYLAIACQDTTVKVWDTHTGKLLYTFDKHKDGVNAVCFSPDGKFLVTGSNDKTVMFWDLATGSAITSLSKQSVNRNFAVFVPGSKKIITNNSSGTPLLWDLAAGSMAPIWDPVTDQMNPVSSVSFNKKGDIVLFGFDDPSVTARRLPLWLVINRLDNVTYPFAFSADGRLIASRNKKNDEVAVWNLASGTLISAFSGRYILNAIALSPGNDRLIMGPRNWNDYGVRVWDIYSGKILYKLNNKSEAICFAVSPDGTSFLAAFPDDLKWYNMADGREIYSLTQGETSVKSLNFSADGRYAVIGYGSGRFYNNEVHVWDLKSRQIIFKMSGHAGEVVSAEFTADGRYVLSAGNDGTSKLWSMSAGKEIVTFYTVGDKDFAIKTPDNYYLASRGGVKGLHFVQGMNVYTFDNFDLIFNRPDIVMERIGWADQRLIASYKRAYKKRLSKMGFTEEQISTEMHLPEIKFTAKKFPVETKDKILSFQINAKDNKYKLDRINVYVNDVPLYGTKGLSLKEEHLRETNKTLTIELSQGKNKIQVSVLNEKGVESLKETFETVYRGSGRKADLYLLAVGVSQYRDSAFNLEYAAKDARDIASAFSQNPRSLFNAVHTQVLTDTSATIDNLKKAKSFTEKAGIDDQVILFAAGHGVLDDDYNYYYATHDMDFNRPALHGYRYEDLESLLDGIPSRKKLFLMDACHSGEIDKDDMQKAENVSTADGVKTRAVRGFKIINKEKDLSLEHINDLMNALFTDLRRGTGATVITSSSGVQFSYESKEWRNGVFTYCLLEGLSQYLADNNKDKVIQVSELRDYVTSRVKQLTGGRQTPTARNENIEDDFIIK